MRRADALTAFEIELAVGRLGGIYTPDPICVEKPRLVAGTDTYHPTDTIWNVIDADIQFRALLRNVMQAVEINSRRWQILDVRRQSELPHNAYLT